VRLALLEGAAGDVIVLGVRCGAIHAIDTILKHMDEGWSWATELNDDGDFEPSVVYTRGAHGHWFADVTKLHTRLNDLSWWLANDAAAAAFFKTAHKVLVDWATQAVQIVLHTIADAEEDSTIAEYEEVYNDE